MHSLMLEMTQNPKTQPWRDNGMLPGSCSGRHFSFSRHRPLSGCEELLCRGYPTHLGMRGARDDDLCRLAGGAPVLQATAACVAALLAVSSPQLHSQRGGATRSLELPPARLAELLARIPPPPTSARSIDNRDGGVNAGEADGGSIVSSRAAALLNLLVRQDLAVEGDAGPIGKEEEKAMKVLKKAADSTPDLQDAPIMASDRAMHESEPLPGKDGEPRAWEIRMRKLQNYDIQRPPIPADWAPGLAAFGGGPGHRASVCERDYPAGDELPAPMLQGGGHARGEGPAQGGPEPARRGGADGGYGRRPQPRRPRRFCEDARGPDLEHAVLQRHPEAR
ncbi:unnamed protein product [Prorocentrum cordatum]|uniref:Uncharacterized protein n=1 Tax=Prorocentrum cordatum TaxID=2364126 RepID=A0ABN9Y1G8_9DINO|nr:unnamed protein product [Polarella glacialis]